jgi:hypothetical protein
MKITDNMGNLFTQGSKNPSQKVKAEQSFSEVLVQVAQGPVQGSSGLKASTSIPPLGALDPANLSGPVRPLSQKEGETPLSAGLIDDVSVPVDDLAEIIGHFEDRIDRLQAVNSAATTPEGLKEVTSDLMITIATEIEKFRRGDYV